MGKVIDFEYAKKKIIVNKRKNQLSNIFKLTLSKFTPLTFYTVLFLAILLFVFLYNLF